jgi:hypothetical protein
MCLRRVLKVSEREAAEIEICGGRARPWLSAFQSVPAEPRKNS